MTNPEIPASCTRFCHAEWITFISENHILVHKIRQGALVGFDAPDLRCGQKNIFRSFLGKETLDSLLARKIQFPVLCG